MIFGQFFCSHREQIHTNCVKQSSKYLLQTVICDQRSS